MKRLAGLLTSICFVIGLSTHTFVQAEEVFTDVQADYWASAAIKVLKDSGVTDGCGGGKYCPNDIVTRSQLAVFMVRAIKGGGYIPPVATGQFNDVPFDSPYAPWIEQFAAEGLTSGCGSNNYCPNDAVTRAQLAVYIIKAIKGSSVVPPAATGRFNDVPLSSPFAPWIDQLALLSLTDGCANRLYCPTDVVTRAQLAVFLFRAFFAIPLNDTGIDWGGNYSSGNNATCTSNIAGPQDCHQGRDATHDDDVDGHAGFSFTKLDGNGTALPAGATSWSCVQDNVTGLIWEVKTDDGGIHDKDNRYRWGGKTRLGNFGTEFYSDWDTLVDGSNAENLCGFNNWRVPTVQELENLASRHRVNPAIDTAYFPNTLSSIFWSASPNAGISGHAWYVIFFDGSSNNTYRNSSKLVRLVRGGQ